MDIDSHYAWIAGNGLGSGCSELDRFTDNKQETKARVSHTPKHRSMQEL